MHHSLSQIIHRIIHSVSLGLLSILTDTTGTPVVIQTIQMAIMVETVGMATEMAMEAAAVMVSTAAMAETAELAGPMVVMAEKVEMVEGVARVRMAVTGVTVATRRMVMAVMAALAVTVGAIPKPIPQVGTEVTAAAVKMVTVAMAEMVETVLDRQATAGTVVMVVVAAQTTATPAATVGMEEMRVLQAEQEVMEAMAAKVIPVAMAATADQVVMAATAAMVEKVMGCGVMTMVRMDRMEQTKSHRQHPTSSLKTAMKNFSTMN